MKNPINAEYRPVNAAQPIRLTHTDGSHTDLSQEAAMFLAILMKKEFTPPEKSSAH